VLLFVAHASIQRARVARFALPRVTSFSGGTVCGAPPLLLSQLLWVWVLAVAEVLVCEWSVVGEGGGLSCMMVVGRATLCIVGHTKLSIRVCRRPF
jgi:hypothetical protein